MHACVNATERARNRPNQPRLPPQSGEQIIAIEAIDDHPRSPFYGDALMQGRHGRAGIVRGREDQRFPVDVGPLQRRKCETKHALVVDREHLSLATGGKPHQVSQTKLGAEVHVSARAAARTSSQTAGIPVSFAALCVGTTTVRSCAGTFVQAVPNPPSQP